MLGPLFRWYLLAKSQGLDIELKKSIHIGLIGYFVSIFVPSGLGLDGSRALYAMKKCPGQAVTVVSTLVMDRLIGLLSMVLLGGVFGGLLFLQNFDPMLGVLVLGLWLAVFGFLAIGLVIFSARFANLFAPLTRWSILERVHSALVSYREHKIKLFEGLLLTLPGHVGIFAATYFGFVAFDVQVSPLNVFALSPIVNLSNLIPLTPMGIGVSEWVASVMYSRYDSTCGADVNMVLRLVNVFLMMLCGVGMLFPVFDKADGATVQVEASDQTCESSNASTISGAAAADSTNTAGSAKPAPPDTTDPCITAAGTTAAGTTAADSAAAETTTAGTTAAKTPFHEPGNGDDNANLGASVVPLQNGDALLESETGDTVVVLARKPSQEE